MNIQTFEEGLREFARYCTVQGTPFGSMPNDEEKLQAIMQQVRELVAEAERSGIEHVLQILRSEEGRLRQVANTVFYASETLAELGGVLAMQDGESYKEYFKRLPEKPDHNPTTKEQDEPRI